MTIYDEDRERARRSYRAERYRDLASADLSTFVQRSIALREIARDEHRTIYEVDLGGVQNPFDVGNG